MEYQKIANLLDDQINRQINCLNLEQEIGLK